MSDPQKLLNDYPALLPLLELLWCPPRKRHNDIPAEYQDALQIGRCHNLIETSATQFDASAGAVLFGSPEAVRRIAEYRENLNPEYWPSTLGQCELAKCREARKAKGLPKPLPAGQGDGTAGSNGASPPEREGEGVSGCGAAAKAADEEREGELTDRQRHILETMSEWEITSERRRKTRADVVKRINRTHKVSSYNKDFAALVKRGYLKSREGPRGGVWLSPKGKTEAKRLRS